MPSSTTNTTGPRSGPRSGPRHWIDRTVEAAAKAKTQAAIDRAIPAALRDEDDARAFLVWLQNRTASERRALIADETYADPGSLYDDWELFLRSKAGVVATLARLRRGVAPRVALAIAAIAGFAPGITSPVPAAASDLASPAEDVRVIDGDTIAVEGTKVRLRGVHCPENGTPRGNEAYEAVWFLVNEGAERVECTLNGERSYDRLVGWCTVQWPDGETADIGATLIANGFCARCPRYDPRGLYEPAQAHAGPWTGAMPGYCY